MITWSHIIAYELLVLDRNTWNHTTMCELFVFNRDTWYHITVCKKQQQQQKKKTLKKQRFENMYNRIYNEYNFLTFW